MNSFIVLILSLIVIVVSSHLFCNALEHLGEKLGISEGVTGSIFAAIGTALPEAIIPILAIMTFHKGITSTHDISVGAILGAPLMLSTLSLFVMSLAVIKQRGWRGRILPEISGLKRDLRFFLLGYGLTFLSIFCQNLPWHVFLNLVIIIGLFLSYFVYLILTVRASKHLVQSGHETQAEDKLFLENFGMKVNNYTIIFQLLISLIIMICFARYFIVAVNEIAIFYGVSAFVLSLVIVPIATELPEKVNSVLWIRQSKDTLAMGNITGAMVFQGTLLPIIGIAFTDWNLTNYSHLMGIIVTFIASIWLYLRALRNNIRVWDFSISGLLYFLNLFICIYFFME